MAKVVTGNSPPRSGKPKPRVQTIISGTVRDYSVPIYWVQGNDVTGLGQTCSTLIKRVKLGSTAVGRVLLACFKVWSSATMIEDKTRRWLLSSMAAAALVKIDGSSSHKFYQKVDIWPISVVSFMLHNLYTCCFFEENQAIRVLNL
ncbi:hypothetical protein L1987_32428 [Smallanthus sonchifolius]|uniref:Uncharacterized protein n=1 Tax=Smallanthus sonchifolius TaxID=185202 RepID=A0ACB9HN72_9ASTR|nr:hypothetical protein L1987_32428 [Smallanthus sonchifolius]